MMNDGDEDVKMYKGAMNGWMSMGFFFIKVENVFVK